MDSNDLSPTEKVYLLNEVEKLIKECDLDPQSDLYNDDLEFCKALKEVIFLKSQQKDITARFDPYCNFIIELSQLNFKTENLPVLDHKDLFAHIAISLNMLKEELAAKAIPKTYLDVTLDYIPNIAFIIDESGNILCANKLASAIIGISKEQFVYQPLFNFLKIDSIYDLIGTPKEGYVITKGNARIDVVIEAELLPAPTEKDEGVIVILKGKS